MCLVKQAHSALHTPAVAHRYRSLLPSPFLCPPWAATLHAEIKAARSTWKYDIPANKWEDLNTPSHSDHVAAASTVWHNCLYVFGGKGTTVVEAYDPLLKMWTLCCPMPAEISGAYAVLIHDYIYIVGGRIRSLTSAQRVANRQVFTYDARRDSWRSSDLPMLFEPGCAYALRHHRLVDPRARAHAHAHAHARVHEHGEERHGNDGRVVGSRGFVGGGGTATQSEEQVTRAFGNVRVCPRRFDGGGGGGGGGGGMDERQDSDYGHNQRSPIDDDDDDDDDDDNDDDDDDGDGGDDVS